MAGRPEEPAGLSRPVDNVSRIRGALDLGDGFYLVVGWTYGAVIALAAAIVSLGTAVATRLGLTTSAGRSCRSQSRYIR